MTLPTDLHALADRPARLAPSHRNPDHYFEEKSEIVAELRRLANSGRKLFIIAANHNLKGFAPGHYMCICNECGNRFSGAKHSWRCQGCEPQTFPKRQ